MGILFPEFHSCRCPPIPIVVNGRINQLERAKSVRCIIIWSVLALFGCCDTSNPPTNAEHDFAAVADASKVDDSDTGIGRRLTVGETEAIVRQIAPCWNIPLRAPNLEELVVEITLHMNRNGTVRKAYVVDSGRLAKDRHYRAMAESTMRAIVNIHCTPLKFPPDTYDAWKKITVRFDPGLVMGR